VVELLQLFGWVGPPQQGMLQGMDSSCQIALQVMPGAVALAAQVEDTW
jgi:hypothetical protein